MIRLTPSQNPQNLTLRLGSLAITGSHKTLIQLNDRQTNGRHSAGI